MGLLVKMVEALYCVQEWTSDEVWSTLAVYSNQYDASEYYAALRLAMLNDPTRIPPAPVRLVAFAVDGVDFIATHARDFTTLDRTG